MENVENIKVLFMGTPDFAACSLKTLIDNKINVVGCFTNPDRPSGRGMKLKVSPVKEIAIANNIKVYQPQKLKNNDEVVNILNELNPDLIVVVAYGKILPSYILDFPRLGCVNVHGSLLPKYRGAAPIQWSIINGESVTGITTMYMDEGMDTGDMLLKQEVKIEDSDNYETLHDKLKIVGAKLLIDTINKICEGKINPIKQPEECTYAPMISKDMLNIDFNKRAKEIFNFVRGLSPIPGTVIKADDNLKYKVYEVDFVESDEFSKLENGKVCFIDKNKLSIKCSDGYINILKIQPENSKAMDIKAFLAGNKKITMNTKF